MKRLVFAFVALVAVAAAVSCSKSGAPKATIGGDVVATANGHEISRAVLEAYTKNRSQHSFKELGATEQARMLDDLIEMVLIADAPRTEDAAAKAALEAQIELTRLNLNAQQKVNEVLKNPPSDAELKAEYEAQAKLMVGVNEYLTRHIVVETEEQALALIKQLKAGANFAKTRGCEHDRPQCEGRRGRLDRRQREGKSLRRCRAQSQERRVHAGAGAVAIRLARDPPRRYAPCDAARFRGGARPDPELTAAQADGRVHRGPEEAGEDRKEDLIPRPVPVSDFGVIWRAESSRVRREGNPRRS